MAKDSVCWIGFVGSETGSHWRNLQIQRGFEGLTQVAG